MAWIRRELRQLGIPPLKRFGQHFLLDRQVRDSLVNEANLDSADTVVEVGAGLGFLTSALASRAGHVLAIENDRVLAKYLQHKFGAVSNVEVIQADALTVAIPAHSKIVSSPPYNISSKLVLRIINSPYKTACLLLQEDFVRRLTAVSGSRTYGRLTVMLQTRARAEEGLHVSRSAFYPEPKVDSAIAKITPNTVDESPRDLELFEDLVRTLFTQRRRKLLGVLKRYLSAHYDIENPELFMWAGEKRVYQLTPIEFVKLSNQIVDSVKK